MDQDIDRRQRFNDCVDACADSMYRVAYRLTGNSANASELVQETYMNAWQSLDSLKDPSRMRSWMFSILRFQYTKWLRRESKIIANSNIATAENLDQLTITEDHANHHQQGRVDEIQQALAQLPDHQKLPLLLVSMEGLSVTEAAQTLDVARGTVLSRLHRAREKLKAILMEEEDKEMDLKESRRKPKDS